MNYDNIYMEALHKVYVNGIKELNNRTGEVTTRYFGLSIDIPNVNYIPLLNVRKMYAKTAAAELAWTLLGTQDTDFINKYSKIWCSFEDEKGKILPAYGYRWKWEFDRDQLTELIEALKKDKSTRQGVVITWNPTTDGLTNTGNYKNVPCPYSFVCNIINGKLNMMVTQRSADMVLGIPYDIAMYSLLNMSIATSLDVIPGNIKFSIADAHIYENLEHSVIQMLDNNIELEKNTKFIVENNEFVSPSVEWIKENPDEYVQIVINHIKGIGYNPFDNIKNLKITL